MKVILRLILLYCGFTASAQDWPRFRGPDGLGSAPDCNPPLTWSDTENIAWKTPLPGAGVSSPIVWGERIFLTAYTGVDRWDESSRNDRSSMRNELLCLRADDGGIEWKHAFPAPEKKPGGAVLRWHGYASHTPVTDGKMVYAYFGTSGMIALDFAGKEVWHFREVGEGTHNYGTAASPVLLGEDKVIVPAQIESRQLIILNRTTGKEVLRIKDNGEMWDGFRWGYSTPVITEVAGKTQIVLGIMNGVAGYDAETGKQIWSFYYTAKGKGHSYPCSSPIVVDGVAYYSVANSHRANDTMAIRLTGAAGELKKGNPNLLWHNDKGGSYVGSVVYHDGKLYFAHFGSNSAKTGQGFFCLDAKTGETVYWAKRIGGPKFPDPKLIYASGLLVKGHIIVPSVSDGVFVIAAKPEFELVAHNRFAEDKTAFSASPVPLGRTKILLRSDKFLYCIGK